MIEVIAATAAFGLTPGDKLAQALARGTRCRVAFSTGLIQVGDVRRHGRGPYGEELWVLSTPTSEHFFGLDEVVDVRSEAP